MFVWYIYKTLWMIIAISGISEYTNNGNLGILFVGLFACAMYNILSWVEHLPKEKQSS